MTSNGQPERMEGYEAFFGLHEAPFSLAPDPRFLFASASHSAALAQVAYALERREPLVVITGEIGTGKTLLCRTMLQRLRRKTFLSVINDPLLERDDLLKALLQDFGVISKNRTKLTEASRHDLIETLHAFLRSLAPIQAHAVVMIDEAQHLQPDVLEEIRLLSNIDDERGTLLQIILVGQTDLEAVLSRPELRQLQQRVTRRFRLEPLNRDEVKEYILHRLALARDGKPPEHLPGANKLARELADWAATNRGVEFTPDAIQAVSQLSGGLPRVINLLCDRSLEEAYASRIRLVDRPLILTAGRALGVVGAAGTPLSLTEAAPTTQAKADKSFWPVTKSSSETADPIAHHADETAVHHADETAPVVLSALTRPAPAPRFPTYLALATAAALAAVAIMFGVRWARTPAAPAPPSAAAPASSTNRAPSVRQEPAPLGADVLQPKTAATGGTPTPPAATAPVAAPEADRVRTDRREVTQLHDPRFEPPPAAPTPAGERFDIVVASFRTDARAASVAAQVTALGLPIRRRVSDGWQQVLSGPFASRTDAEKAQQRLRVAGITGTQVVPTVR